jgi:predicted MFS family arabinose efflux permease
VVAASALSVVGIGSAIGKFGFGWLCDFIPPKYILVIGSVLQAGATLILVKVTPDSPAFLLWLYAIMFGLGIGSWLPAISMTTNATFGLIAYGDIFGIYTMLFMVNNAVAPWVGGYIFDTTGNYHPAFLLSLIFYAPVVLCMLLTRRPKRKLAT